MEILASVRLEDASVRQLRTIARERHEGRSIVIEHPKPGSWVASASKEQLIELLRTGKYNPAEVKDERWVTPQQAREIARQAVNEALEEILGSVLSSALGALHHHTRGEE